MSCNCKNRDIPSIRKGNDIEIKWAIYTGSGINMSPYNLEGKKVAAYLKTKYHKLPAQDVSVSGHVVTFYFYGKDQQHIGPYSIELIENEGYKGMHTVDECKAFELVKCTCEADGAGGEGLVSVTSLEFRTSMQIGQAGVIIDTELSTVSENPVQNKVITEEFESIRGELEKISNYDIIEEIVPPEDGVDVSGFATIQQVKEMTDALSKRLSELEDAVINLVSQ